ncbi:MAG: GTP 3',8-cyclase MoaA [Gammaproteobacteria bacterium]|jgi:GTP 3',8-cyclase|nr:GTP 3',8-cyclase MoaA [Gammaproteobacteria bacterium]
MPDPATALIDKHGRHIDYVRLSLTDRCDFRCVYCMAEEMTFLPRKQILSLEEIYKVASAFTELGVNKIRLTGGEPLVRNNVMSLIQDIGQLPGLDELLLTTNGSQLEKLSSPLRDAGVNRINISLDSLNAEKFKKMTRTGKLEQVLKGVETAVASGFDSIRLNTVVLRGINDDEIVDLLEYAMGLGISIAYIEEMPLGNINDHQREDTMFSNEEVMAIISEHYALSPIEMITAGPSRYYQVEGSASKVGFISPVSHNFCESCNRVRVTVEGRLLLCLGNEYSTDLRQLLRDQPENSELLKQSIVEAMDIKPLRHYFYDEEQPQIVRFMNMTGG